MFEAVAAAATLDDLGFQVLEVERDGDARERVEVLKGDRGGMGAVDLRQSRIGVTGQTDAPQIASTDASGGTSEEANPLAACKWRPNNCSVGPGNPHFHSGGSIGMVTPVQGNM